MSGLKQVCNDAHVVDHGFSSGPAPGFPGFAESALVVRVDGQAVRSEHWRGVFERPAVIIETVKREDDSLWRLTVRWQPLAQRELSAVRGDCCGVRQAGCVYGWPSGPERRRAADDSQRQERDNGALARMKKELVQASDHLHNPIGLNVGLLAGANKGASAGVANNVLAL